MPLPVWLCHVHARTHTCLPCQCCTRRQTQYREGHNSPTSTRMHSSLFTCKTIPTGGDPITHSTDTGGGPITHSTDTGGDPITHSTDTGGGPITHYRHRRGSYHSLYRHRRGSYHSLYRHRRGSYHSLYRHRRGSYHSLYRHRRGSYHSLYRHRRGSYHSLYRHRRGSYHSLYRHKSWQKLSALPQSLAERATKNYKLAANGLELSNNGLLFVYTRVCVCLRVHVFVAQWRL